MVGVVRQRRIWCGAKLRTNGRRRRRIRWGWGRPARRGWSSRLLRCRGALYRGLVNADLLGDSYGGRRDNYRP